MVKPERELRETRVHFKARKSEREQWKAKADFSDMSLSQWIRKTLNDNS